MTRDDLGRIVRSAWIEWALQQPVRKPSWLVLYDELSEADKEADRQIAEAVLRGVGWQPTRMEAAGDRLEVAIAARDDEGITQATDEIARLAGEEPKLDVLSLKLVGYGRDAGRLVRVEVLDGADRIDLFRPAEIDRLREALLDADEHLTGIENYGGEPAVRARRGRAAIAVALHPEPPNGGRNG